MCNIRCYGATYSTIFTEEKQQWARQRESEHKWRKHHPPLTKQHNISRSIVAFLLSTVNISISLLNYRFFLSCMFLSHIFLPLSLLHGKMCNFTRRKIEFHFASGAAVSRNMATPNRIQKERVCT